MPTPLRRRLRLARRGLGYTVAIALVLVALLLAVVSQVLPMAERNPDRVAAWLSERAGRPIRFDRVETEWTRRGPLLKLDNLRVGEGGWHEPTDDYLRLFLARDELAQRGKLQEVLEQQADVFAAFAQRRQGQAHHIEPVVEVAAKLPGFALLLQVGLGRGDHPAIHLH